MRNDPMIDQSHQHQVAQAAGRQRQQGGGDIDPLQLPTRPFEFVFDQTDHARAEAPEALREPRNPDC